MTTVCPGPAITTDTKTRVYPPQHDSRLLVDVLRTSGLAPGSRVADLCTGSGVIAVAAANMGASDVHAFDISIDAVEYAEAQAATEGARVTVVHGSWTKAHQSAPFDVVVANPPYVPALPGVDTEAIPDAAGPSRAWDAGEDGRLVLDPLCVAAPELLTDGGALLLVQSEFSGVHESLKLLRRGGLRASVVATEIIAFGPVMRARAKWLERTGRLQVGRRTEELVVIRADKP